MLNLRRGNWFLLPELNRAQLTKRLASKRGFVWIKRDLTPRQQWDVIGLGLPGVDFRREETRVYPQGRLVSHARICRCRRKRYRRCRTGVRDEFAQPSRAAGTVYRYANAACALWRIGSRSDEFSAKGAAGLVLDVRTSEVMAMCSLPDFDPNGSKAGQDSSRFNRVSQGVYELGSAFKIFTTAMALEAGVARLDDRYDATKPLKISRFTIRDYHAKSRWLSVSEIFMYSSNIGSARLAMEVGGKAQRTSSIGSVCCRRRRSSCRKWARRWCRTSGAKSAP